MEFFITDFTDSQQNKTWDNFIENHVQGSIHHLSVWAKFQSTINGRTQVRGYGLKDKKSGDIIAATISVHMDTGFFGKKWAYSARGPVCNSLDIQDILVEKIAKIQQELKCVFWRLDPYLAENDGEKFWKKFDKKSAFSSTKPTQQYQPTDTLMLDLSLTEEELLKQMKRQARSVIKKLEKNKDISTEEILSKDITKKDLDDFWLLNQETTSRDSFSGHQQVYYKKFLKFLPDHAVLFFVTYQEKRIGSAITTFAAQKAIYYFGASSSDHKYRKLRAPYLLQWAMIRASIKRKCNTYDFLGIAPLDQPDHVYKGITQFKTRFGGFRATYHPGREIILSKTWYNLYKMAKKLKR